MSPLTLASTGVVDVTPLDDGLDEVRSAVASVCDPEYPDVSIADLGMVERVAVDPAGDVRIGLVPTFAGCPALGMIAADVRDAVAERTGRTATIEWLSSPVWSTDRITPAARAALAADYTVTLRRKDGSLRCPRCGATTVRDQAMAGPTRCRSVAWCDDCRNVVEVMR